ncbi:hypothetical protein JZ785_26365 [Alicyclobacillus curvatus]|nr:hypothetical protein JZ785_26365 [Alicyclobacillus curvatus]
MGMVPGGPGGGLSNSQSPPFTVPMRYMLFGIVGFLVFAVDLALQSEQLGHGMPLEPSLVAVTHMLTLGSLLAFVMGAVYQLSTVAFLIPLSTVTSARWNFWVYAVGVIGLISSMIRWWIPGLVLFGSLVTLSLYAYVAIVLTSIRKTTVKGPVVWFVASAHVNLALAVTAALLLILSFVVVPLNHVFQELLVTHIVLAAGGFFTFLILGFSYKLLPMFTLAHGFSTKRQPWTFAFAQIALWVLLIGVWAHVEMLIVVGGLFGMVTLVNQGLDFRGILQKRLRRRTETPMTTAVAAVWLAVVGMLGLVLVTFGTRGLPQWQGVVTFYLMGWVTLTVMSYAYKIVPFLIWTKRFSRGVEKGKTPLIKDMINVERARPVVVMFVLGLIIMAVSSAWQFAPGVTVGAALCALAVLWFCTQMVKVLQIRKLSKELMTRD